MSHCSVPVRSLPAFLLGAVGCVAFGHATQPQTTSMAAIPAGDYRMGTDSSEIPALLLRYHTTQMDLFAGETPRKLVRVRAFTIDRTEVTDARYAEFLRAHPEWRRDAVPSQSHNGQYLLNWRDSTYPGGEAQRPVTYVTWPAAQAFCRWLGKRLPTEAEWEYAARGGLPDPEFPWGNEPPDSTRANWSATGLGRPTEVARFPPNGYGLYDMAGNVWEFVADVWPVDSSRLAAGANAEGSRARHVIRGGSYGGAAVNLRVRYRDSHPDIGAGPHVGFRCAGDNR